MIVIYNQNNDDLIKILLICAKGVGQGKIDKMMKECETTGESLWEHVCNLVKVKTKSRAKREIEAYNSLKTCKDILSINMVKMNHYIPFDKIKLYQFHYNSSKKYNIRQFLYYMNISIYCIFGVFV